MFNNGSFPKVAGFFIGIYILSFSVTAVAIRRMDGGAVKGIEAPSLEITKLDRIREFSDITQIPGTDRLLMVEDENNANLFSFRVSPDSAPDGPVEPVPLPAPFTLKDMEGLSIDPRGFVYVVSSHSLNSEGVPRRGSALARMRWTDHETLEDAQSVPDLRDWLEATVPEIAAVRNLSADDGGLNIEGLAYDAERNRILLGLRGPLFNNHPALVPIRIIDPAAAFDRKNFDMESPIVLEGITGFGIRSISHDPAGGFWILTGGGGDRTKTKNRFSLWHWNGKNADPVPVDSVRFDKTITAGFKTFPLRPEGVCAFRRPGRNPHLIVTADGSPFYFKMNYLNR